MSGCVDRDTTFASIANVKFRWRSHVVCTRPRSQAKDGQNNQPDLRVLVECIVALA